MTKSNQGIFFPLSMSNWKSLGTKIVSRNRERMKLMGKNEINFCMTLFSPAYK